MALREQPNPNRARATHTGACAHPTAGPVTARGHWLLRLLCARGSMGKCRNCHGLITPWKFPQQGPATQSREEVRSHPHGRPCPPSASPHHQERSRQASRTNGPGQPVGTGPSPPASVAHRAFPRRRGGPSLLPPAGMLCCHMFIWDKRAWSARTSYEQTSDGAKVEARAGGPDLLEPATLGEEPRCSAGGHQAPTWPPATAGLSGCRAQPAFPSSHRRARLERTPCGWGPSSFCCLPRAAQIQIRRSQGEAMTLKHP